MSVYLLAAVLIAAAGPRIAVPFDGAQTRSAWAAIEGEGAPNHAVHVMVDGRESGSSAGGPDGHWAHVVFVGRGAHKIEACSEGGCSPEIKLSSQAAASGRSPIDYSLLQIGDVILDHSLHSEQEGLYRATYTHAALYVGGGPDGTPLIAEAVNADLSEGLGEVRAVPPEQSLAFSGASRVDLFRLRDDVQTPQKAAAWVRETVKRRPGFWSTTEDFAALYDLWRLWDFRRDAPYSETRFAVKEKRMLERKWSLDRFNCATLVWRAYLEAGSQKLDLSEPNLAFGSGNVVGITTPRLLNRIKPLLIAPDTLALSGKLRPVQ